MSFDKRRAELCRLLQAEGFIKTERVKKAFLRVRRELFVPEDLREQAYDDIPLPIGRGQTISAPHGCKPGETWFA